MRANKVSLGRICCAALAGTASTVIFLSIVARAAETGAAEVDPKMRRELEMAEERLGQAIEKRDPAALTELLADYFSAALGDDEKAATKGRTIARAKAGTLVFYRIERDVRLRVSADHYDLEGEAKSPPRKISDRPEEPKWVHVRRVWTRKDGRWLLVLQHVGEPEDEKEKETGRKEK